MAKMEQIKAFGIVVSVINETSGFVIALTIKNVINPAEVHCVMGNLFFVDQYIDEYIFNKNGINISKVESIFPSSVNVSAWPYISAIADTAIINPLNIE